MRVFVTSDPHGDFTHIADFCNENNTTINDIMIILGDAGINYYLDDRDRRNKNRLAKLPITFFCIHGNHEERPCVIDTYHYVKSKLVNGYTWMEPEFPNILFAEDDNIYYINKNPYYVLGGAYSVDKFYRIALGYKWFGTEQIPTLIERINGEIDNNSERIQQLNKLENLTILTHTCPYKYMPTEAFLSFVDQSTVDNSIEELLNKLEANIR